MDVSYLLEVIEKSDGSFVAELPSGRVSLFGTPREVRAVSDLDVVQGIYIVMFREIGSVEKSVPESQIREWLCDIVAKGGTVIKLS